MKKPLVIAILLAAVALCHAEPRWCSITGKGPNDKLFYPPIAKAARVSGVVLSRIVYKPNGKVENIETISGPPMLSKFLAGQMSDWTVMTNAEDEDLCVTLVIAKFHLNEATENPSEDPSSKLIIEPAPSILRLELSATPVCLCDPEAYISSGNPLRRFAFIIKRGFRQVFYRQQ